MTTEQKAKAYDEALQRARELNSGKDVDVEAGITTCEYIFPELKDSEDERIRKESCKDIRTFIPNEKANKYIAWPEKQKDYIKFPNSAYTSNRDVVEFADKYSHAVWEDLMNNFKKIENYSIGCNDVSDIVLNAIINTYNWLEKRGPIDKDKLAKGFLRSVAITIMQYLDSNTAEGKMCLSNMECEDIENAVFNADWAKVYRYMKKKLEKQGEKDFCICIGCTNDKGCVTCENGNLKEIKVEPKFKVGDWIVLPLGIIAHIESLNSTDYQVTTTDGKICDFKISKQDNYRLWSITDAKNGDLIYVSTEEKGIQAIFHEYKNDTIFFHCYLCADFVQGGYMPIGSVELTYPLQKTHYNRFFEKMHEAGYEWDGKKKELKKIESKTLDADKVIIKIALDVMEKGGEQ